MHSGAPFAKKGGADLSLPSMDIPISLLSWEVFLPEQYKVKDFGGDVIAANLVPAAFREEVAMRDMSRTRRRYSSNCREWKPFPDRWADMLSIRPERPFPTPASPSLRRTTARREPP